MLDGCVGVGGGADVGFDRCGGSGGGELVEPARVGIGGGIVGDFVACDVDGPCIAGTLPVERVDGIAATSPVERVDGIAATSPVERVDGIAATWPVERPGGTTGGLVGDAMRPDAFGDCAIGTAPVRFAAAGGLVGEAMRPEAFGDGATGTAPVRFIAAVRPDASVASGWLVGDVVSPDEPCCCGLTPDCGPTGEPARAGSADPDCDPACAPACAGSADPGGGATDVGGGIARPDRAALDVFAAAFDAPDGPAPIRDGTASSSGLVGSSFSPVVATIRASIAMRSAEPGGGGGIVRCFLRTGGGSSTTGVGAGFVSVGGGVLGASSDDQPSASSAIRPIVSSLRGFVPTIGAAVCARCFASSIDQPSVRLGVRETSAAACALLAFAFDVPALVGGGVVLVGPDAFTPLVEDGVIEGLAGAALVAPEAFALLVGECGVLVGPDAFALPVEDGVIEGPDGAGAALVPPEAFALLVGGGVVGPEAFALLVGGGVVRPKAFALLGGGGVVRPKAFALLGGGIARELADGDGGVVLVAPLEALDGGGVALVAPLEPLDGGGVALVAPDGLEPLDGGGVALVAPDGLEPLDGGGVALVGGAVALVGGGGAGASTDDQPSARFAIRSMVSSPRGAAADRTSGIGVARGDGVVRGAPAVGVRERPLGPDPARSSISSSSRSSMLPLLSVTEAARPSSPLGVRVRALGSLLGVRVRALGSLLGVRALGSLLGDRG